MSVTTQDYQEAIFSALHREFGQRRHAAKIVANLAEVSPRTAQNWFQRLCAPQGAALINLMSRCEAIDEEMDRLRRRARGEQS